jgi:hypothetical protein
MSTQNNKPAENSSTPSPKSHRENYLDALVEHLQSPDHKRIVEAYRKGDSVKSMEDEFAAILCVIAKHEDKKDKN